MTTIYAVSTGGYDEYAISALFTTKAKAQEYMLAVKDEYNYIEEYELDPRTVSLLKRGYSMWVVFMLFNGDVESITRMDNARNNVEEAGDTSVWQRSTAPYYKGKNVPDVLTVRVWAKTEQQAIKIVNRKREQMIDSGEFKESQHHE